MTSTETAGSPDSPETPDLPDAQRPRGFAAGLWRVWVLLIWVIPLVLFVARFLLPGAGWETIMLLLYIPVWYPLLALIGMVAWWVWRSRAKRAGLGKTAQPPALLITSMLVHWGGLILMAVTYPGFSDDGRIPSMFSSLLPLVDIWVLELFGTIGLIAAIVGLVGTILVACFARIRSQG